MMNMNFPKEPGFELRSRSFYSRRIQSELWRRSPKPLSFEYVIWPVAAFMLTFAIASSSATIWWIVGGTCLLALAIAFWKYAPDDRGDNPGLSDLLAVAPRSSGRRR